MGAMLRPQLPLDGDGAVDAEARCLAKKMSLFEQGLGFELVQDVEVPLPGAMLAMHPTLEELQSSQKEA